MVHELITLIQTAVLALFMDILRQFGSGSVRKMNPGDDDLSLWTSKYDRFFRRILFVDYWKRDIRSKGNDLPVGPVAIRRSLVIVLKL